MPSDLKTWSLEELRNFVPRVVSVRIDLSAREAEGLSRQLESLVLRDRDFELDPRLMALAIALDAAAKEARQEQQPKVNAEIEARWIERKRVLDAAAKPRQM